MILVVFQLIKPAGKEYSWKYCCKLFRTIRCGTYSI